MTNEELKLFLIFAINGVYGESTDPDCDAVCKEVLSKLESGHIFVGQWRTDVENAPQNGELFCCADEAVYLAESPRSGLWVVGNIEEAAPDAFAELPAPPKEKP